MAVPAATHVVTNSRRPAASAGDPILTSKITAPDVPDWAVQRPRITTMITQGMRWCPLTVVTGPLGAGKTMALASWAAAEPGPVAWVSADEFDNRPGVFWSYVVAALRRSGVAVPRALPATVRGRVAEHSFLLQLASVLAAQDPPVRLVVDDFHLLTEPKVLNGLDFLLRNVGSGLRLVLASRMDPLLPLRRYRVAGQLAEIGASDLAFTAAEAGLLLAQHECTVPADLLECLTGYTEGWATGLRLAAMSMGGHPDPEQFVKELMTGDSALTGYLLEEVFSAQPPEVREVLLSVSILEQVNADVAAELTGNELAGQMLAALAHANAFVQEIGRGWYRFHAVFAAALSLKLGRESPDRVPLLHRHAARWYARDGRLADAVRHAGQAGDWPLAARLVIDELAVSEIIEPRNGRSLAARFAGMPYGETWAEPEPYLVSAAIALSAGRPESAAAALDAAEKLFERLPAGQEDAARLAAATIRFAAARRTGDHVAAAAAAARAEAVVSGVPGDVLARHQRIRARALFARGTVELWSGRFGEAARVLGSGVTSAAESGEEHLRIDCLSHLALVEALRGRLDRAAKLAGQATTTGTGDGPGPQAQCPKPAALAALAWVHVERHELREMRSRLKQLDTALGVSRDRLIGAVACLITACGGLAEGRAEVAARFVARARSGWSVPSWLEQRLNLAESRACLLADNVRAALAIAERGDGGDWPEATVMLVHARAVAGETDNARRTLQPLLTARDEVPERVRVQACLADARLSYHSGDRARGRRSLGHALRLAEREQLRLPFALERGWIGPVLERDPELASTYRHLVTPAIGHTLPLARPGAAAQATIPAVEPLTEREREVLRHVSGMLTTAEIASELYISANTVKAHIKSVCHKLAVGHRGEAVRRARQLQLI